MDTCSAPPGMTEDPSDCDDDHRFGNPSALEVCDGLDNDCVNLIDDADAGTEASTKSLVYEDSDGDGDRNTDVAQFVCITPSGYTENDG